MEEQGAGDAIATLVEDAAIQTEVTHKRLALEWGQIVFAQLLGVWNQIEAQETLAYEDKVAAQICLLQEASSSLWHLHRELARTCRLLKEHRQQLKRPQDS